MRNIIDKSIVLVTLFRSSDVISSPAPNNAPSVPTPPNNTPDEAPSSTEPSLSLLPSFVPSASVSPAQLISSAPSTIYEKYLLMDEGMNSCADGFELILLSAECEEYADNINGIIYQNTGPYTNAPKGCFIYGSTDVYFSTHPIGFTNKSARPICKPMTSLWSASPSYTPTSSVPSIEPSKSPSDEPSLTNLPSVEPSMSLVPTTIVPSFSPSQSLIPSSKPSSKPSRSRIDWWASNPIEIIEEHTDVVSSVSFSPNGAWLASSSYDNTVKLWSAKNVGGSLQTLTEHNAEVYSVDFSPDGTKLVSSGYGIWGQVILWNIEDNGTVSFNKTLEGHRDNVASVKFSPNGKFIASGSFDKNIIIWSMDGGKLLHKLEGHRDTVRCLSFSVDGKVLASGSHDNSIKLWDVENSWTEVMSYSEHTEEVVSVDFSPDGILLASGSWDTTVKIWNFQNSTLFLERTLVGHSAFVSSVKFSTDGKYLASASTGTTIILWDRNDDYYPIKRLERHTGAIQSIDFTVDGQKIVSGSLDKTIRIWGYACEPGTYGTYPDCEPCAPGSYKPDADMPTCIPCARGTAQNKPGATECNICPIGTFQPFEGLPRCEECRVGGYCANMTAADTCDGGFTVCPVGTFNNVTGAYNKTSCVECPPGTYSDNRTGLELCFDCPKGTYSIARSSLCSVCDVGTVQNQTGQSSCEVCPSDTFPDQSRVTCLQCPYRLGSDRNSEKCSFCADEFYLKAPKVELDSLIIDPANFCLPCPSNTRCAKNTTIETLKGSPHFWRASLQTAAFYKCNDIAGVCFGGISCAEGHRGVRCEVCVDRNKYFSSSKGECTICPSFSRIGAVVGLVTGLFLFLLIMKNIAQHYKEIERVTDKFFLTLIAIGIQTKLKIVIFFCQVVATFQPIYGVRMHSAFTSWFRLFDIFYFDLMDIFGMPDECFGSMKWRLLIGAGWPCLLALILISGIFVYTVLINLRRLKKKDAFTRFLSRSLNGVIVIFYFVLPSVCKRIFDARICKSFASNDAENELISYLIADLSLECENGDAKYEGVQKVFWALFAIWPVSVPLVVLILTLFIRPSARLNNTTPLAEACRFLWFDYNEDMIFWDFIDLVRKITLTGLIIFIDTENGEEGILRLLVATIICVFYGTILLYARPYKHRYDFNLAVLSNFLLTCFFLLSIIIHQCKEGKELDGENNMCMKLFGLSGSYGATQLVVILTVVLLIAFVIFTLIHSMNELNAPSVSLVSTNDTPYIGMPGGCKYHFFASHTWASGQDKVHKIVAMLKLYIQGVKIWLDVDFLQNLSDIEKSVEESAHFLLFYSKGYFESFNCRREVLNAMKLEKPITIVLESDEDFSVDKGVQMREEFNKFWPKDSTLPISLNYIFVDDPIVWISKSVQFSLESIKLVTGRLLRSLPFYQDNAALLDAGIQIDGEIMPVEMLKPVDVLYCSTNIGAYEVALKLVQECQGNVRVCAIDLSVSHMQKDNRKAVMLVYLNKRVFQGENCRLCDSIICAMGEDIQIVFVHENDPNEGCAFWQIIEQTPEILTQKPYSIYSKDIAVNFYSIYDYQKISLRQILLKVGAKSAGKKSISDALEIAGAQLRKSFK